MASRIPRSMPPNGIPSRHPEPFGSPLHPPTPTLQAQLSFMLQQSDTTVAPSPLFPQQRNVHFQPQTPRSAIRPPQQLQTPRSTPQPEAPPTPLSLLSPRTPRSVHFNLPPAPPALRSVSDAEPPRQLQETTQRCTRCRNVLCIPPSTSFILATTNFRPVNMDRSNPRCVACDLTRTKELCKDIIAPAPAYVDPILKIEKDVEEMEGFLRQGVKVEEMRKGILEGRRRMEEKRRRRREMLEAVWERFYGAWGPGVKATGGRGQASNQ